MNQNEQLILWAGVAVVVAIAVIGLIVSKIQQKKDEKLKAYVLETSERYRDILKLNEEFMFLELPESYTYHRQVNSKAQLARFNYDGFLEEIIENDRMKFEEIIRRTKINREMLKAYTEKLKCSVAKLREKEEILDKNIPFKKYRIYEEKVTESLVREPVTNPEIFCYVSYTSPKGRNSYQDEKLYSIDEVIAHFNTVNRRNRQKESKEYQRKIMTDSLRYDIMKRDGFHCVLCGRGAEDGVKLHVDHIIPVSKGGKTVPENLRTLCENCNLGKRDKYDNNSVN